VDIALSPRQRGDFQTPVELARQVWSTVNVSDFDTIIEPTFGLGAFLKTLPPTKAKVIGWEIEPSYFEQVKSNSHLLYLKDVFTVKQEDTLTNFASRVLVIGNPPWITNSEQSSLGGLNTGTKRNLKSLSGLDALTGKANYDISEAIILHFVSLLKECEFVQFALLGKFKVLRNLVEFIGSMLHVGNFEFHRIDSKKHFNAAVDSGLIKFQLGSTVPTSPVCTVYANISGPPINKIAIINKQFVYDADLYQKTSFLENRGVKHYVWRQGIKHDVRDVMELIETERGVENRLGEVVDVEPEILYRLYKSSDIFHGRESRFLIPMYQRDLKDNLEDLDTRYPKLYAYLLKHKDKFRARKSSIYRNRNIYSVFGIGTYTHLPFKIIIGGMYSEPRFQLIEPSPRLAMPDDTGYMLATESHEEAIYLLALLTLCSAKNFLLSISHSGDKRRFSKEVLGRLLIPPMKEVSIELLRNLVESWNTNRSFLREHQTALEEWLKTYQPVMVKSAKQSSLF
jgi:hypothetical protein